MLLENHPMIVIDGQFRDITALIDLIQLTFFSRKSSEQLVQFDRDEEEEPAGGAIYCLTARVSFLNEILFNKKKRGERERPN